jgi:hypothetical protein
MHTLCPLLYKLDKPRCKHITKTLQEITTIEPTHYIQISPTDAFSSPEIKITESKVWPRSMMANIFYSISSVILTVTKVGQGTERVHIIRSTPVPTP